MFLSYFMYLTQSNVKNAKLMIKSKVYDLTNRNRLLAC
ncbi:hypothetical protein [Klebsiella phage Kpn74]|uniref:Uncharacterized protein n=1 Tax=Klebsiella phage Kpn74 TaxID=3044026 RepID=A0AAT9V5K8_9CAUD|nr:hypothetical protein [Klebsiella phage Kpn74]